MSVQTATPWHKASYDQFLHVRLPQLLAERLPLADYQVVDDSPPPTSCRKWRFHGERRTPRGCSDRLQ